MYKLYLLLAIAISPIAAFSRIDVAGGSGFLWAGVSQSDTIFSDTVERKTKENILMRETIFLALRYSSYEPKENAYVVIGFEGSTTLARPTIRGQQTFTQKNSSGQRVATYTEDLTQASAPSFSIVRGSMHVALMWPLGEHFAVECGVLAGLSAGMSKTDYSYNFAGTSTAGGGNGLSGLGAHIAFRTLLTYYLGQSVALSLEYRMMGEIIGSILPIPFLGSSSSVLDNSGHLFLASIGYRFGKAPVKETDPVSP